MLLLFNSSPPSFVWEFGKQCAEEAIICQRFTGDLPEIYYIYIKKLKIDYETIF